jgi:hypothetical protein
MSKNNDCVIVNGVRITPEITEILQILSDSEIND